MITLLPLFIGMTLYLLNEKDLILLSSSFTLYLIYSKSIFISSEIIIIYLLIFFSMIWMDMNKNILLGIIFLLGSILTIFSTSIFSLFISIEILSMTMIILINLYIKDKYAGILYYLFSGLFSGLFIISLGYLSLGYIIAYKFFYIVLFFKLGLVPFHILLPNIYNNLTPKVIILIDIPYKILLFWILYKLNFFDIKLILYITLIIGAIGSLHYQNLLSLLIYSSLFNYGLILISIYYQEIDFFLYFIFIYALTVLLYLYLITSKFFDRRINNNFYLTFWFLILINLIGIPPFNGFFIKFFIMYIAIFNSSYFLVFIISLGILLFTYTYLRILISMIMNDRSYNIEKSSSNYSNLISIILILVSIPILF